MRRYAALLCFGLNALVAGEFGPGTTVAFLRQGGIVLAGTADLNRDGLADIVGVSSLNNVNTVGIRISATGGVDSTREIALPAVGRAVDLLLADIAGDVEPDIAVVVVNGNTQANLCFIAGSRGGNYGTPTCTPIPAILQAGPALRVHLVRVPPPTLPTAPPPPVQQVILMVDGPRGVVLAANPTGSGFSFVNTPILVGRPIDSMVITDLNADGASDAVYSSEPTGVYAMNLVGLLRASITSVRVDTSSYGPVAAADLDQDGRPEVAVLDRVTGKLRLFTASTTAADEYREVGTGIAVEDLPATGRALFVTDIDRDGRLDLVTRTTAGLTLLRGGPSRYSLETTRNIAPVPAGANLSGFSIAEVNGDAQMDLVYAIDNGETNPAASSVVLHTGRPSFTATVLELSANPVEIGMPVRLTARINNASQTGGFGAIGGTVQFFDGASLLETAAVAAPAAPGDRSLGSATIQRTFAPGSHDLRAVYSGSTGFLTSTWQSTVLTVRGGTSELRITSLPPPIMRGDPFSLVVDVVSAGITNITGNITAFLNTMQIAQAPVQNGRATVALPTSDLPLGPVRLRFRYEGAALPPAEVEANLFVTGRLSAVNAASYAPVIVPDGIAVVLAPGLRAPQVTATALPWPAELGGLTIEIRDSAGNAGAGRLYYTGTNQVNFLAPPRLAEGAGELRLQFVGSLFISTPIRIARSQPGIFTANGDGRGVPAALAIRVAADGTQTPVAVYACGPMICQPNPIELRADDQVIVSLYGTAWRGANNINAVVGNIAAELLYRGAHPTIPGLDQINLRVPNSVRGEVDVYVVGDGVDSNRVRMSFR